MATDRKRVHISLKFLISGFNIHTGEREAREVWAFNESDARFVASDTLFDIDLVRRVSEGHVATIYPAEQFKINEAAINAFWNNK